MKTFIHILVLVAVLAMLCGCVSSDPADTTDSAAPGESTTTAPTGTTDATETKPLDDGKETYTVTVKDQNGNPVAGVSVQFCDENGSCQMPVKTDEDGIVTKRLTPMVYHITLTLPDGYTCDTLEYNLDGTTELAVVVTAN